MKRNSRRLTAFVLAAAMLAQTAPALAADDDAAAGAPDHIIINQVYGGSNDGAASHSFIELYNPTASDVDMNGWSVQYRSSVDGDDNVAWQADALEGTIKAGGYYLIRCGAIAEPSQADYQVPAGDDEWDIQLHNKGLAVALVEDSTDALDAEAVAGDVCDTRAGASLETQHKIVDLAAVQGNDAKDVQIPPAYETAYSDIQSKKKAIRRVNFQDTDNNEADFEAVDYSETVSDANAPHNSSNTTGGGEEEQPSQPTYEAVTTTDKQYTGYENGKAALDLTEIGRYNAGAMSADGGSAEIVVYNDTNDCAYVVNGLKGTLDVVPLKDLKAGESVQALAGQEIDVKDLVEGQVADFTYGDMTSVSVSPDGKTLVAALQAQDYDKAGYVAFFSCAEDGTLTFEKAVQAGVQPDMVTFTQDGTKVLTADEGEPREGYGDGATDPAGTVSIVDVTDGTPEDTATQVGFSAYDDSRDSLAADGIIIKKDADPSTDFEPEYIAATNDTAYVTLQEANAIATLDLDNETFTNIDSAGFEDHGQVAVDINKEDETYAPKTYPGLLGIRMPDGISLYETNGQTYLLTANEGDSREWNGYLNEVEKGKGEASPAGNIKEDEVAGKVVYFDANDYDGLDASKDYLFGGRSFTLFQVTEDGMQPVYDSADDFERLTAAYIPDHFNCSNDDVTVDDRSGKKGPEPESVTTGTVDGKTYAFVTLERTSGVMVYDITDPAKVQYVNYINSRDFSEDIKDDDSPEGLKFVPAAESTTGDALLLAACEVSGTLAVYSLTPADDSTTTPVQPPSGGSHNYAVSVSDSDHGQIVLDQADRYASAGERITISVTPDEGYAVDSVTVLDRRGDAVDVTDNGDGTYSFTMPAGAVSIAAAFKEAADTPDDPDQPAALPFVDVSADDWFYPAVDYVYSEGLMTGTANDTFAPDTTLSRAMIASILYRMEGEPAVSGSADFTDVAAGSWYADAVTWAADNGLAAGYGDGTFGPNDALSREQMAAFLYRYAEMKGLDVSASADLSHFSDASRISGWAEGVMSWAVGADLLHGQSDSILAPQGTATRAEVATVLMNADSLFNN